MAKDPEVYPDYDAALPGLWRTEATSFDEYVVFDDENGDLATLLTAPYTLLNDELAAFYGVPGPSDGSFDRVELDPTRASGLLTQGGVLAMHSAANRTSPVHRGLFVREQLLCGHLAPPPPNLEIVPPEPDPNQTVRALFEVIGNNPVCGGCHILMNPLGFGFENYDGIGRWRDDDNGLPIDATGDVVGTEIGTFDGPVELGAGLAESPQVRDCMVSQWFRYSQGRLASPQDQCSVNSISTAFDDADGDIKALLIALTQSDAFLYRAKVEPESANGGAL